MGTMSINFGPDEEYHISKHKNKSRYVNELVKLARKGHLKDISKMTAGQLAAVLTRYNETLPDDLRSSLQKYLGGVE